MMLMNLIDGELRGMAKNKTTRSNIGGEISCAGTGFCPGNLHAASSGV